LINATFSDLNSDPVNKKFLSRVRVWLTGSSPDALYENKFEVLLKPQHRSTGKSTPKNLQKQFLQFIGPF
jgi:hypothetical protein